MHKHDPDWTVRMMLLLRHGLAEGILSGILCGTRSWTLGRSSLQLALVLGKILSYVETQPSDMETPHTVWAFIHLVQGNISILLRGCKFDFMT